MNIKTLCHHEYKRISIQSLLNPLEGAVTSESLHSHSHVNSGSKATPGPSHTNTKNGGAAQQDVQKRRGITRKCPQCDVIKTSPQWREGPNGEVTLCNACGLFYRKVFLVFGKSLAKRYFDEIKGASVKRKVPRSLYGVMRTH
ncbi:hypothetical protein N7582_003713 [Saccharomyces uvarum]|uniref:GATA-type domain-containing protein n=1 Tax=Saccharomyces uvarum TaxID=230603 RepID=A0AA35NHV7_SACUV|nr:hypothetical protein N7582_003713 [Saccharomyces uvarum]CAI4046039.1 hypothetical protein SUVC_12G0720 [Saccharomyces uvarum]